MCMRGWWCRAFESRYSLDREFICLIARVWWFCSTLVTFRFNCVCTENDEFDGVVWLWGRETSLCFLYYRSLYCCIVHITVLKNPQRYSRPNNTRSIGVVFSFLEIEKVSVRKMKEARFVIVSLEISAALTWKLDLALVSYKYTSAALSNRVVKDTKGRTKSSCQNSQNRGHVGAVRAGLNAVEVIGEHWIDGSG